MQNNLHATLTNKEFFVKEAEAAVLSSNQVALSALPFLSSDIIFEEFYRTFVEPKLNAIESLDKRRKTIFEKMMSPVALQFDGDSSFSELKNRFFQIKNKKKIADFKTKYLNACAYDSITALIEKMDSLDPSILDNI